jgi:hypothetical protein
MRRRDFLSAPVFLTPPLASAFSASEQLPANRALMKVGTQHGDSDAILRVLAGFGAARCEGCLNPPSRARG